MGGLFSSSSKNESHKTTNFLAHQIPLLAEANGMVAPTLTDIQLSKWRM